MRIISKKDIVIPKGTLFKNCDNSSSQFYYDNYDTYIALDKDTTVRIIVSSENKEYFQIEMPPIKKTITIEIESRLKRIGLHEKDCIKYYLEDLLGNEVKVNIKEE